MVSPGCSWKPRKVLKHERSQTHKRGQARQAGAPGHCAEGGQQQLEDQIADRSSCTGVLISDQHQAVHCMEHSILNFCEAGQPQTVFAEHERNPLGKVIFDVGASSVRLRSRDCQSTMAHGNDSCPSCKAVSRDRDMWRHIAQKSYMIDLVTLAHVLLHNTADEAASHVQMMKGRDYMELGFAGNDFMNILSRKSKMDQVRAIQQKLSCWSSWRIGPS